MTEKEAAILLIDMNSRHQALLQICELIDNEDRKLEHSSLFKKFCKHLHEHESSNDENIFNEGDVVQKVLDVTLDMKNYCYKMKMLKILLVYWQKKEILCDEIHEVVKNRIMTIIPSNRSESIFLVHENVIRSNCDHMYFELIFLIKEYRLKQFEFKFEEFIKIHKEFYGEYWKYGMKFDAQLLCLASESRQCYKTTEFIFQKCSFIQLNSTILREFEELEEFSLVFDNLTHKEEKFLEKWKGIMKEFEPPEDASEELEFIEFFSNNFKDTPQNRKLLLGRKSLNEMSLLEEMLNSPCSAFIFNCAWNQFRLWTKPELLSLTNPMGKTLIHYAIESDDDEQIFCFLMPIVNESTFHRRKYYMVMQNSQFYTITGECLSERLLKILMESDGSPLFRHFMYLLEEIGVIKILKRDYFIERLIQLANNENFLEEITGLMPYDLHDMKRKFFTIDDIIGNMIVYWQPHGKIYEEYKENLLKISPFYKLMFLIIEKKSNEFCRNFQSIMNDLEESYKTRYNNLRDCEKYSSNMLFIMLLAAIKTNQRCIIDFIFSYDTFETIEFEFSENIIPKEIHYYTALKLLKHKHEIGRGKIPREWLSREVIEEFFDSKINYYNQDFLEIEYSFLLHIHSQKLNVKSEKDVDDKLIMWDDMQSIEYIVSQENLKQLVLHPVLETYINLKSLKYQRIFVWNFWAFVLFFIIPFSSQIWYNHINSCNNTNESLSINSTLIEEESTWEVIFTSTKNGLLTLRYLHYISIIFLIIREGFQYKISPTTIFYFEKLSNIFDITLILLSIALSISSLFCINAFTTSLEVAFILFTTISATSILPFAHVPTNMQILKKVALTFLRIFYTFAIILIAFSFSFCIMFEDNANETCSKNCTYDEDEDYKEAIKNFRYPTTSLVKIVTMLSGEYEIQPASLSGLQLLFFMVFVISSFILFNLILGLSIEDVQELKKSSRLFDLLTKAERFTEVNSGVRDFYIHNKDIQSKDGNFFRNLSFKVIRFFLSKFIYLHNIQKILVDIKTKQVYVSINKKQVPILSQTGRFHRNADKYLISKETFKDIQEITSENNRRTFKKLKKKMDMEKYNEEVDQC